MVGAAAKEIKIPIIAGLGVWDWQDIVRYIMAGATLVQSGVGIMLQGYKVTQKWQDQMTAWMEAKGYQSLGDMRGMALPNVIKTAAVPRKPTNVGWRSNRPSAPSAVSACGAASTTPLP